MKEGNILPEIYFISYRECDAKNLNLSPFCDLSQTGTEAYWADQVVTAYTLAGKNIGDPEQVFTYIRGGKIGKFRFECLF